MRNDDQECLPLADMLMLMPDGELANANQLARTHACKEEWIDLIDGALSRCYFRWKEVESILPP